MADRDEPRGRPGARSGGSRPKPTGKPPAKPPRSGSIRGGGPSAGGSNSAPRPRGTGASLGRPRDGGDERPRRSGSPRPVPRTGGGDERPRRTDAPRDRAAGDGPGRSAPSRSGQPRDRAAGSGPPRSRNERESAAARAGDRTRTPHAGPRARRTPNPDWTDAPPLPEDLSPDDLDPDLRREVASLSPAVSERVAGHLLAAIELVGEEPELALRHARAARSQGGRLGTVREAVGVIAYEAGDWALALADLRAGRRITGHRDLIALEADCERALGRPEKALALATGPLVGTLDRAGTVELAIVASGARRDLGQAKAAVLALEGTGATDRTLQPWSARLRYAYAAALLDAGRRDDARRWFQAAAEADAEDLTDAAEQAAALHD